MDLEFEPAGLGSRILAYLLDTLILGSYAMAAFAFVIVPMQWAEGTLTVAILFSLPLLLYHFLCETFLNGQSIGKQALKIQVVRLDGKQANAGNFALRSLLRLLEITPVQGSFAIVAIVSTRYGQRLGDLAAGTTVVRVRKEGNLKAGLFRSVEDAAEIRYPEVIRLSNTDAETIGLLLEKSKWIRRQPMLATLIHDARNRLIERLGIESDETDVKFLEQLLTDYNRHHSGD